MYQYNLFCKKEETNFNSEREFQDSIYDHLSKFQNIKKLKKELSIQKKMRFDIYFEYSEEKYIIECKLLKNNDTHKTISALLEQMFKYQSLIGNQTKYLIAICGDTEHINKLYGDRLLFPISQTFAYFGFYFIIFDKDKPFYYNFSYDKSEERILSYSNGNGYNNLNV